MVRIHIGKKGSSLKAVTFFVLMESSGAAQTLNNAVDISQRREKIRRYKPGDWTSRDAGEDFKAPPKIRLGVFGLLGSGKSTFLNSLHFALKGYWKQIYVERAGTVAGGETIFRDPATLTTQVTTFDTRGLEKLAPKDVQEVIAEMCGQRAIDPRSKAKGEKIDCPVFILKYSPVTGIEHCRQFLEKLVPGIRQIFGAYPIMVVTFANNIKNRNEILDFLVRAGMEEHSVFFIENYTSKNHKMDPMRDLELLQILEACIERADDNITFVWRKQNEVLADDNADSRPTKPNDGGGSWCAIS